MPTSIPKPARRHSRGRWTVTVLLIYGAMCVGLLGFFTIVPDEATQSSQVEKRQESMALHSAKKGRYEGVIASWNRYRSKLSAEVR